MELVVVAVILFFSLLFGFGYGFLEAFSPAPPKSSPPPKFKIPFPYRIESLKIEKECFFPMINTLDEEI